LPKFYAKIRQITLSLVIEIRLITEMPSDKKIERIEPTTKKMEPVNSRRCFRLHLRKKK